MSSLPTRTTWPYSFKTWLAGIFFAILAQALFGTTFAFNKYVINHDVDPILLGFNRMTLATLTFLPLHLFLANKTRWNRPDWISIFLIGGLFAASAIMLEYMGTKYTTASNASLIISTEAVFSTFLAVLLLREHLNFPTIIGGICALIGMALVMLDDIRHLEIEVGSSLLGDLLVLTSVVSWGLYTIYSKKILAHSDPIQTIFYGSLFCALTLSLVNLFKGTYSQIFTMNTKAWSATLYLGICCSGFGHFFYYHALKRLPASIVCMTLTLLPVFGVLFSILLLHETLSLSTSIGAVIIIGGLAYAVWPREKPSIPVHPGQVG